MMVIETEQKGQLQGSNEILGMKMFAELRDTIQKE